jgi:hypothetical protein
MRIKTSFRIPRPLRLARVPLRIRIANRRVAGCVTAIERVMRRSAVQLHRAFTAHVRLQALRAAGVTQHVHRTEVRQLPGLPVPVHTIRQQQRILVTQRLLRQRLVERRVTRTEAAAAAPRLSFVTRAEQRQGPRLPMTLVRSQPVTAKPATAATTGTEITGPERERLAPSQPRFAPSAPPLVLPPQELSRLTDHVIRQLDHRVLSWQERTGRA